jgi:hypothetical protein
MTPPDFIWPLSIIEDAAVFLIVDLINMQWCPGDVPNMNGDSEVLGI